MRKTAVLLMVTIVLFVAATLHAGSNYVDITNVGGQASPYTSWATAATNIQLAVDAASAYDTVWVRPGVYTLPTNHVVAAGTNVVYVDKPIDLRSTAGAETTIIDGEGLYRCLMFEYDDSTTNRLVEGFTVTGGAATNGAGIRNLGDPLPNKLYSCVVSNNHASNNGGGYSLAPGYRYPGEAVISNCVFQNNSAGNNGGALSVYSWNEKWLYDSVLKGNSAGDEGGAISTGGRDPFLIQNCVFQDNRGNEGGAISGAYLQPTTVRNSLFVTNYAYLGSVFYGDRKPQVAFENCTIVSNAMSSGYAGRGIIHIGTSASYVSSRKLWMYNCIMYHNVLQNGKDLAVSLAYTNTVFSNNCIAVTNSIDDFYAHGNITNAPVFVDFAATNLRHKINSPCVDTGVYRDWMLDAVDLDGNPRVDPGGVDIGAYEHRTYGTTIIVL